jgi:hypothetical protein
MGEMRNAYKIMTGEPEGKRPFGRSRHRWEDNIRMDWMHLVQDRSQGWALVLTVMNLQVP